MTYSIQLNYIIYQRIIKLSNIFSFDYLISSASLLNFLLDFLYNFVIETFKNGQEHLF